MSNIGPGLLGLAWEDGRVAGNLRAYAQIIDNTGAKAWTADGVEVSNRSGKQATPFIISDGNDGVIVAWEDMTAGLIESDVYAQRLAADGTLQWSSAGVPVGTAGRIQQYPSMVADGENGAVVIWMDYRSSFSNPDLYASRLLADGSMPLEPPVLELTSRSVAFGVVSVGDSKSKSITLSNTGGVPVTITSVTSNDAHFSLTADSSTLFPGSSAMARLRFQPTSKDTLSSYIVIESNSIAGPDTVFVTGSGTAAPEIEIDKSSLAFGSVATGSSRALVLNVSNTGNDTLVISTITTDDPSFTVAIASMVLAPGTAFDDTVRFSPTDPGAVTGELTLISNAPTSPTVLPLTGTGVPVVTMTIDLADIDFGEVVVGTHRDTSVTVTNTGNDTLYIADFTSGDARFTLETPLQGIAPA